MAAEKSRIEAEEILQRQEARAEAQAKAAEEQARVAQEREKAAKEQSACRHKHAGGFFLLAASVGGLVTEFSLRSLKHITVQIAVCRSLQVILANPSSGSIIPTEVRCYGGQYLAATALAPKR